MDLVTTATWATVRPIAIALQLPAWALLRKQAGQFLEWTRGPYMAKGVSKAAVEVLEPAQRRPPTPPWSFQPPASTSTRPPASTRSIPAAEIHQPFRGHTGVVPMHGRFHFDGLTNVEPVGCEHHLMK